MDHCLLLNPEDQVAWFSLSRPDYSFPPERRHPHDPVCLEQTVPFIELCIERRAAGTRRNHVREDVGNHETGIESCFVYWYRWRHRAQEYLLKEQLPVVWKREKEWRELVFVFSTSLCVCTSLQDACSLLGCVSEREKITDSHLFPLCAHLL